MKKTVDSKPIKLTKRLSELLKKWKVKIRTTPTDVTHLTYGTTITVDPIQFAVYELAINTVFNSNMAYAEREGNYNYMLGVIVHYQQICDRSDMVMPYYDDNRGEDGATDDYHYCCQLLIKAGLYFDLLD